MKQSMLFVPTQRETPADAEVFSHQALLRGGYIKQVASGIYAYLPLATRVLQKIEGIIREELNRIGCVELLLDQLQPKDLWCESGRWNDYGKELMRLVDRHERDFCLGPTHEEVITAVVRDYITSYKKLPLALYQIQTKFRDEFRPRFGLMRCREFVMKDLYTFSADPADLDHWYELVREAYIAIFTRLGLDFRPVAAASGPIGGKSSEEFMVLSEIGEDTIVYSDASGFAANYELYPLEEGAPSPDGKGTIRHAKGIEVGHIFKLGTKYSIPMKAQFVDKDQQTKPVWMGCYGIGVSRLLMALLEQHHSANQVFWPEAVAPFAVHVLPLDKPGSVAYALATELESTLSKEHEVLIDDRDERPGVKFKDADLIGCPVRVIVGKKAPEGIIEIECPEDGTKEEIAATEITSWLRTREERKQA